MSAKKRRMEHGEGSTTRALSVEDLGDQRVRKACLNCRRQKMKCIIEGDSNRCRRCQRADLPCIFVPRANAASLPDSIMAHVSDGSHFKADVLRRLQAIEDYLGLSASDNVVVQDEDETVTQAENDSDEQILSTYSGLGPLWDAAITLQRSAPTSLPTRIWSRDTIEQLWSCFHDRMPRLHFMPYKESFPAPSPLLLASMLYCSSRRGPPDTAKMAPYYFTVLCIAISQLSIPGSEIGTPANNAEEWAFQNVLGIVVAGLMMEADVRETGIWISIAYRLILEYCPSHESESTRDWCNLFSGVQILDLEHAALHLSCPVIPIEPPLQPLKIPHRDQLYRLSRMMHTGLTHFTGRNLPTIWSCFEQQPMAVASFTSTSSFTAVDAAVIRDWARQLDDWLVEFSHRAEGSDQDRQLVFRQYVLHRLVVLSIYHPARGCNLWSASTTLIEQHELLLSARSTLKLYQHDESIWANFDLVMITWAALIALQGILGGVGEAYDLENIRVHLESLKRMNEPKLNLCDKLIGRLEGSLNSASATVSGQLHQSPYSDLGSRYDMDQPGQIFDQAIFQQMVFPTSTDQRPMGLL